MYIYIYLDLMSVGSRFVEVNPPDEGQKSVSPPSGLSHLQMGYYYDEALTIY